MINYQVLDEQHKASSNHVIYAYQGFQGLKVDLDLLEWFGALETIYGHLQTDLLLTRSF